MTKSKTRRVKQRRDERIMELLFYSPCTSHQVLEVSKGWTESFSSLRSTQEVLKKLRMARWVERYPYRSSTNLGGEFYYKLTTAGFRMWLDSQEAQPPTKRFFREVADGHHHHTYWQSKIFVHFLKGLYRKGLKIENVYPENTFTIQVEGETPHDCDFRCEVVAPSGRRFPLIWEIDRSTETLVSSKPGAKDWSRLNRIFDGYADQCRQQGQASPHVLVFTTKSRQRAQSIVDSFGRQTRDPNRLLCFSVFAEDFLSASDPIHDLLFLDHRRSQVPMIPRKLSMRLPPSLAPRLETVPAQEYATGPSLRPAVARV